MRATKYDWSEVQRFYDSGNGVRATIAHFGMSRRTWDKAITAGRIVWHDPLIPLEQLLVDNRPRTSRQHLKKRLLSVGLLISKCAICGLRRWRGKDLSLQLDHVNGRKHDNRIENLRLLCPNCHSQTETYGGRNKGLGE